MNVTVYISAQPLFIEAAILLIEQAFKSITRFSESCDDLAIGILGQQNRILMNGVNKRLNRHK